MKNEIFDLMEGKRPIDKTKVSTQWAEKACKEIELL